MKGDTMPNIYWHRLSEKKRKSIMAAATKAKMTYGEFKAKYSRPTWCTYPDALLHGDMGCWSLMDTPCSIHTKKDCKGCECKRRKKRG